MSTSKPVVVLVPGVCHTPEGFTPLITALSLADYPCIPVSLPSAAAHPGHPDFSQDVSAIRSLVTTLVEAGKDVLIVLHSAGSVCGSEALAAGDLSKEARAKAGKEGGVVRLVYIGILLPQQGKSMFETFTAVLESPELDPEFERETNQDWHVIAEDGTSTITDGDTRFYSDLPTDEAKYWGSRMVSCSLGAMMSPLTYEAWNHIPSAYVVCLNDKSIPLKQVREIVKRSNIEMVLELESGHCPYLSQTKAMEVFIRKTAGEAL